MRRTPLLDRLRFSVDSSDQEAVFARNDFHGVVILDFQQLEERFVEDETAAVSNPLELLNHVLTML